MASIFQDIFGGGTQQTQSTSTPTNMNPLTNALSPTLGNTILSYLNGGTPQYNGPLTAGMTGPQNTSLGNLASAVAPNNSVNNYIDNVLSGSYMPGGANGNPFLSANISASVLPIQESLKTTLGQTNPSLFAANGQQVQGTGSSAFQNADALAVQSAANAESSVATQLGANAYNTGIAQMTSAANLQPQEVQSAINVLQAQLLPTLLQEQGITNGLTAFQDNVTALLGFLQNATNANTPVIGNTQQSTGVNSSTNGILPDITAMFKSGSGTNSPFSNIAGSIGSI